MGSVQYSVENPKYDRGIVVMCASAPIVSETGAGGVLEGRNTPASGLGVLAATERCP